MNPLIILAAALAGFSIGVGIQQRLTRKALQLVAEWQARSKTALQLVTQWEAISKTWETSAKTWQSATNSHVESRLVKLESVAHEPQFLNIQGFGRSLVQLEQRVSSLEKACLGTERPQ